jgi:hypothetical protein
MTRTIVNSTFLPAWLLALLVLGQASEAAAAGGRVHLVVAADTSAEADLGGDVVADKVAVQRLFQSNVPAGQLNVTAIEGDNLSPQSILGAIGSLDVKRYEDSVVFYFTGHGAFDPQRGHFFALPRQTQLLRSELELAIVRREPRTAVTITDCCAGGSRYRGKAPGVAKPRSIPTTISPLFAHLLFDRCGLFSITSSKPPEISLTRGDGKGSLFTYPFVRIAQENASRRLDWSDLVDRVEVQVAKDFQQVTKGKGLDTNGDDRIDQRTQTVHAFVNTPALGLRVQEQDGQLKITQVIDLSPAFHALLEPDDVVLAINGAPVRTERAFGEAVDRSPRTLTLTVRDHRTNRTTDVQAHLNP